MKDFKLDGPTQQHLRKIYQQHAKDGSFQDGVSLSNEASFTEYMRSRAAGALRPPPETDLSHPLSSYYISSSHNTYLTGNQLYGDAKTDGYTNVLNRGCRCLEIDIWDGDDSDTSASSSDEEGDQTRSSTTPKKSRWGRMKAKAAQIRGPSPNRDKDARPPGAQADADSSIAGQPSHSSHLSDPTGEVPPPVPFKAEPQVVHGWTLTQSIPFRTVCAAIRKSAFTATDLPLIVSLETHASLEQQETMVDIMKEAWGEYLISTDEAAQAGYDRLPTPDLLRNKILIKVKWTPGHNLGDASSRDHTLDTVQTRSTDVSSESASAKQKPAKMLPALSEMGMFTRAFSFKAWNQPEATIPTHVFSLTESKAHDMHPDPINGPAMFHHNKKYLTRIYPKGTRIRSSNYDPTFHWRNGAQIVALNWQSLDKGMMLNEGMFAGYEGWVLKPDGYRSEDDQPENPAATPKSSSQITASVPTQRLMDLKIQVFSGENIPVPHARDPSYASKMKPFIKFELHVDTSGPPGRGKNPEGEKNGANAEEEDSKKREQYKRRSKTQKHDAPDFEGEAFTWTNVEVVEKLTFLR